jgi:hypothetical protein
MPTSDLVSGRDPGMHRDFIRLPPHADGSTAPPVVPPRAAPTTHGPHIPRPTSWPRVAPILMSPWPDDAGGRCHGWDPTCQPVAQYAVWTDEDTGDGYRLACSACLGGWVDAVMVRLILETPAPPLSPLGLGAGW